MDDLRLKDAPIRLRCKDDEVCTRLVGLEDKAVMEIRRGLEMGIATFRADAVIAPLALGSHVDHMTTRAAVLPFVKTLPFAFYEDIPYAGRAGVFDMIERTASELGKQLGQPLSPLLLGSSDDEQTKHDLASLYASQIGEAEAREISEFGRRYGGHERVWATAAWVTDFAQSGKASLGRDASVEMRSA